MKSLRILAVEAKDLYGAMNLVDSCEFGYSIRNPQGEISIRKFTNALDYSLDYLKLREVYRRRFRRNDFSFRVGGNSYTTNVICVKFKYSYKEFNHAGKNTYIRRGYLYRDCDFEDGVCVKDGRLIAIQTNVEVKSPVDSELLEGYFSFCDGHYEQTGDIPTVMTKADLRNYLYTNGFVCDGVEYVRYKRSSGSSRVGKCLFVNKELAKDMSKWDKCGLEIEDGQPIDLAAWEAYIALPMSSIIDTLQIPLESILVINDEESVFEDDVIAVGIENGHLASAHKTVTIKNSLFDGESLLDKSMFGRYANKGMLLLRNRFFKSCCFNTNLQKWFSDNGITSVEQLNGFTLATDISQVKMVTTPSSIKYAKFGKIEDWLRNVEPTFGVVKYEKPTYQFDGRMVQAHYQLFNTLQLSYAEMEKILKPSLDYISAIRRDPAVLRYAINYPIDEDERWSSMKSRSEIVFTLLGINDKFAQTKLYREFRNDLVRGMLRNLKRGHALISGNYSTLLGNGTEMLAAAIGKYNGEPVLKPGQIHSKMFAYGKRLLGSRSPHICAGNVLLVDNVESKEYDEYFNLTNEIVCITAAGFNIQQQLNGCDYDSDTMLLTDNELLVEVAERNYGRFKVPTNMTESVKINRHYTDEDRVDLDIRTSVNKIGEIVNLSQQLNSLMWERIHKGATIESCSELYEDICKLAVLSNVEIDRAKKEFVINSSTELDILKRKYKITDDERTVKPMFFKMITTENGYELTDNVRYRHFETPMDYLQRVVNKFHFREGREKVAQTVPFMSMVAEPRGYYRQGYYYRVRDKIIDSIRAMKATVKTIYARYETMTPDEKTHAGRGIDIIKETCVEEIKRGLTSPNTKYFVLKEIDNPQNSDIAKYILELMFNIPDSDFVEMLKESKEKIYTLVEMPDGDIKIFDFEFEKIPLI